MAKQDKQHSRTPKWARNLLLTATLVTGNAGITDTAEAQQKPDSRAKAAATPNTPTKKSEKQRDQEFAEYWDKMRFDNDIPQAFHTQSTGKELGVVNVEHDTANNAFIADTKANDYLADTPNDADKIVPHKLVVVDEKAEQVEFVALKDVRTKELAGNIKNQFKVDTSEVKDGFFMFVDGKLLGEEKGKADDGRTNLKPFVIPAGMRVSVMHANAWERTTNQSHLDITPDENEKVKLVDLSKAMLSTADLYKKYEHDIVFKNNGRKPFEKAPDEFKKLPDKDNKQGITSLSYDTDNRVWLAQASGNGYDLNIGGVKGLATGKLIHKLMVVPENAKSVEFLSPHETKAIGYNKDMMDANDKLAIDMSGVKPTDSVVYLDKQILGIKRIDPKTKKEIITPFTFNQKEQLSVITHKADERYDALEIKVGANPVKNLHLLDNSVHYNLEDAPVVTPDATGYARKDQQETNVILHGDGKHKAKLNLNQAYQTSYIGIAEVMQNSSGERKKDAPAHYIGTTTVTGGATTGSFVVHNIMADIHSEEPPKYESPTASKYAKSKAKSNPKFEDLGPSEKTYLISTKPKWKEKLGELNIEFDGKLAATINLGSASTQESLDGPMQDAGARPNPAADPAVQGLLWLRKEVSPGGMVGKTTVLDLQMLPPGSHTIGRFAGNLVNDRLRKETPAQVGTLANSWIDNLSKQDRSR